MAPPNYYSKKKLTEIGLEGFALIDEFYGGGGRKGRKQPNYSYATTYKVTSRQLPPPQAPPATSAFAFNHSAASSSAYSRRLQQSNTYRYSPPESLVRWSPAVAAATETTTAIQGYDAVTLHDGEIFKNNYMYYY